MISLGFTGDFYGVLWILDMLIEDNEDIMISLKSKSCKWWRCGLNIYLGSKESYNMFEEINYISYSMLQLSWNKLELRI